MTGRKISARILIGGIYTFRSLLPMTMNFLVFLFALPILVYLPSVFDLIVVNRCLPYFLDYAKTIVQIKQLLNPGGCILLTGLNVFRSVKKASESYKNVDRKFMETYGRHLHLKGKMDGLLETRDLRKIKNMGFKPGLYPKLIPKTLSAKIIKTKPAYYYA